ncbi:MAG: glycosyltransferase [Anaeromicrobium sp.]|jgi:spore maturation protein CgeB|uniref:glycosyltransferase family protein n=1 Tax=Anaeromicrobium sp. TaxID=1929132 RepID=UPI0025CF17F9|nr:glycosyltransferase [Anaeromicrobium sp.]MCT4595562.1 glycosyltransferase [Anaeromicrobium sp.]
MPKDREENKYPYKKNKLKKDTITIQNLKVACILDDFSYECFKYECNLIPLGSYNWKQTLIKEKPNFLLVESAWTGHNGQWRGKIINLKNKENNMLKNLVNWCKNNNIPTVFWNKEDPGHFHEFMEAAKLFDYIFTTDSNCICDYKEVVNHNNIYTLPFAAQPKVHNPINKDTEKLGKVAYAGSWYAQKLPQRRKDLENLLKPSLKYGLHIYDRYYNLTKLNYYKFPYIYAPYIKGSLPYKEMIHTYKKYDIFLNVNSSRNSPTMFSRRVFELLVCGTNILSGYSLGIKNLFPNIVKICETQQDTEQYLKMLLEDKVLRDKLSLLGQRAIFKKHTYRHRLETIVDKINLNYKKEDTPGVSIITCTNRPNNIHNIFENYENQNYSKKELIIIINNNNIHIEEWKERAKEYKNVRVFQLDEYITLGKCLNFGVEQSTFEIISKFDDDDYYAPNYLIDLINTFTYTNASVVGKYSTHVYFEDRKILALIYPNIENRYMQFVTGSTLTFKKKVFNRVKFINNSKSEDTQFLRDCKAHGFNIYATDRFNHVFCRKSSLEKHSWKISDDELLKKCKIIAYTDDYKKIVTI